MTSPDYSLISIENYSTSVAYNKSEKQALIEDMNSTLANTPAMDDCCLGLTLMK
jgi:hypothetical protein